MNTIHLPSYLSNSEGLDDLAKCLSLVAKQLVELERSAEAIAVLEAIIIVKAFERITIEKTHELVILPA